MNVFVMRINTVPHNQFVCQSGKFAGAAVLINSRRKRETQECKNAQNRNYSVLLRNPQFLHKVEKWKRAEKNQRNVNIQEAKKVIC